MSRLDDLKRELAAANAAIEELDGDLAAGRVSPDDHMLLKERSELEAAALLARVREAEAAGPEAEPAPSSVASATRLIRPAYAAVAGAVVLVVGLGAGFALGRWSQPGAVAPGAGSVGGGAALPAPMLRLTLPPAGSAAAGTAGSPTAMPPGHPPLPATGATQARPPVAATVPPPAPASPELEALLKDVQSENAPIEKLVSAGRLALEQGQRPAAIWAFKRVLAREPKNVEALTGIGVILGQGHFVDQALARIDEAIAADPRYAPAHWERARLLFEGKQDYPAAIRAAEGYLALSPGTRNAERARSLLAEARTRAAAQDSSR